MHELGGWTVTCQGSGCKSAADHTDEIIANMLQKANQEYVEQDEVRNTFCSALSGERPAHCEAQFGSTMFWPHLSDPSQFWNIPAPVNGCGTGSIVEGAINHYVGRIEGTDYSGNPDEPINGYSFQSACNTHDACYSQSSRRGGCDLTFKASLQDSCGSHSLCKDYAHLYGSAVSIFGTEPYNEAQLTQQCREFKEDIAKNCPVAETGFGGT